MANSELKLEVFKQHRETTQKYVYYILTINAAAIGYCIGLKVPEVINVYYLFHLLAILCWGFSFYAGCGYLFVLMKINQLNNGLFDFPEPEFSSEIKTAIKNQSKKSSVRFNWMVRFLIAGFVFFIVWHVSNIPFYKMF